MNWVVIAFALGFIIFLHEVGHFITAKRAGIEVKAFALGLGPRLAGFTRGGTSYQINWIPFGGYVAVEDAALKAKPIAARVAFFSGGAVFNLITALLIVWFIVFAAGVPGGIAVIQQVNPGSPAALAGVLGGDKVLEAIENSAGSIGKVEIRSGADLAAIIQRNPGAELGLVLQRGEKKLTVQVVPAASEVTGQGAMGVMIGTLPVFKPVEGSVWQKLQTGIRETYRFTQAVIAGFGQLFSGKASVNDMSGPVGIVKIGGDFARYGFFTFLEYLAMIGINLMVLNLLPVPALDGGRLVFLALEALRGKPFAREETVHWVVYMGLLAFIFYLSFMDILRVAR